MSLPTAQEINPDGDLDGNVAQKNFLGKTLEEAVQLFEKNALSSQEDLMWMGPTAFCYYFPAAVAYVRSSAATGDSDIVSCLTSVVEFQLDGDGAEAIASAVPDILELCDHVLESYERFEIDEAIYGDLRSKYRALAERLRIEPGDPPDRPTGGR